MDFNNNEMFQSVCWTLVHSLWQGLVLALLAGLVVLLTQKTSATLRYNLLGLLGFVFIIGVSITFYIQTQTHYDKTFSEPVTHPINLSVQDISSPVLVTLDHPVMQQQQQPYTVMDGVAGFLDHNAAYIVALWFIVFAFKTYRLFRGLQQVNYLRHYGITEAPVYWSNRLEELKRLLQMNGRVRLVESVLVKVPSVVGFFKPVILLPVGLLANMPAAEAEAILLHELAHIRRKDYLVNLVQGFGEVVFFFNPGFLWVSSLIKTEREHCCDDLAVTVARSKTGLVKALVYTQQYSWDQNQLALGFGNKKTPLLDRAKRILNNNNQTLNNMEKTFLSLGIAIGLCVAFAFNGNGQTEEIVPSAVKEQGQHNDRTNEATAATTEEYPGQNLKEGTYMHYYEKHNGYNQSVFLFKHEGVVYQVTGDVRELKVNGKVIPQENWGRYMPVVDELMARYHDDLALVPLPGTPAPLDPVDPLSPPSPPCPPAPPGAPAFPSDVSAPTPPAPPAPPVAPTPPATAHYFDMVAKYLGSEYLNKEDSLRKKEIEAAQRRMEADMKKLSEEMRQMEKEMARAGREMSEADKEMRKAEIEMRKAEMEIKKAEMEMERANMEMVKVDMEMARAEREMRKAELAMERANASAFPYEEINAAIKKELGKSIKKVESYKLDGQTLIVNGKKQPSDLHKRLSEKYIKGRIKTVFYEYTIKEGKDETTLSGLEIMDESNPKKYTGSKKTGN